MRSEIDSRVSKYKSYVSSSLELIYPCYGFVFLDDVRRCSDDDLDAGCLCFPVREGVTQRARVPLIAAAWKV